MKTRVISGIVMALILAVLLCVGKLWAPWVITVAVAVLAEAAVYELLHNAVGIKSKATLIGAGVYCFFAVFAIEDAIDTLIILSIVYFLYAVVMVLKNHKDFTLAHISSVCALPLAVAFAFFCLAGVVKWSGIYYLLLLLNFSSVCDMGAYFAGTLLGRHKLCPEISPKKTVEGAIGGIVASIIVTVILSLCFDKAILVPIIATIPLCIVGMLGDLFASSIKRAVGIKDYGNLIPGHGGILDRVDSILMIVPLLYVAVSYGVL